MLTHLLHQIARLTSLPPRVVCFVFVGCMGLGTDMSVFSLLHGVEMNPLSARGFSLAVATIVTWQLNRKITFESKNSALAQEAGRYALVTLCAQGVSYFTFVGVLLGFEHIIPQFAVLAGAVAGALFSFQGHTFFSFAAKPQQS